MATNLKKYARYFLIGFYIIAGSNHLLNPQMYTELIPDYLPYHTLINYGSGLLEITLALGVAFAKTRYYAAIGIILMLLLFIPSHLFFIKNGSCVEGILCVAPWVAWFRLVVFHSLLMYWVWLVRK